VKMWKVSDRIQWRVLAEAAMNVQFQLRATKSIRNP